MNLKINSGKLKFNGNLIVNPFKNRNTYRYQFQVDAMTNLRNKYLDTISNNNRSNPFDKDITIINSSNEDLINDIKRGKRNMEILVQKLIDIQTEGRNELSNIANEMGNKITDLYKYLIDTINEQNKEKIKLEIEINNALRENSDLRRQISILTNELIKLEEINKINNQSSSITTTKDNSL